MTRLRHILALIALLVAATLAIGTAGFVLIEDYPWFDAFYMAVITMTTVGYMEVHPLSQAGRIFNSFLLLFGVGIMFFAVGAITQNVVELQFAEVFNTRRMKKMIEKLNGHYILCGFGRVGRAAAAELKRTGVTFVVIDRNPDRVEMAAKQGMLVMQADSARDETLLEAGIQRARGLIAALATDADNVFLILSAKNLNPSLKVASRVAEEASETKLRHAGADAVFTPYSTTGYRLAQSILRPHVYEFLELTTTSLGMNVWLEEVHVTSGSSLAGRTLRELQLRRDVGVIVLAIRKALGEMQFNPLAEALVEAGDHLIVMGADEDVRKLEQMVNRNAS
ncbi:MAG: potassium channel protein [Acidimicrobiia bacterium]|nr:potassium channel protein [Acidimicrobiia bacterium]